MPYGNGLVWLADHEFLFRILPRPRYNRQYVDIWKMIADWFIKSNEAFLYKEKRSNVGYKLGLCGPCSTVAVDRNVVGFYILPTIRVMI